MKKYLSLIVVVILVIMNTSNNAFAKGNEPLIINGNEVMNIYHVEGGIKRKISVEEHNSIIKDDMIYENNLVEQSNLDALENEAEKGIITPDGMTDDWYRYDESSYTLAVLIPAERKRVSTIIKNETLDPSKRIFQYSASSGQSFSVSLTTPEKSSVGAGASFSWYSSKSVSDSNEITIRPNYYGWFEFAPLKNKSVGYAKTFSWLGELKSSKYVVAYSPATLHGVLDGILYEMTSLYHPAN